MDSSRKRPFFSRAIQCLLVAILCSTFVLNILFIQCLTSRVDSGRETRSMESPDIQSNQAKGNVQTLLSTSSQRVLANLQHSRTWGGQGSNVLEF